MPARLIRLTELSRTSPHNPRPISQHLCPLVLAALSILHANPIRTSSPAAPAIRRQQPTSGRCRNKRVVCRWQIERPTWTRLGDSGDSTPALDTAGQCDMSVVRTWVRMLRIPFVPRIRPSPGMGPGAGRRVSCALVDRSSSSLKGQLYSFSDG